MVFDNLLGGCVPESDLTLRCEIMLPDADVMVFWFVPGKPAPLLRSEGLPGGSVRWSVGVGGVTSVSGASSEALVGVFGVVRIAGRSGTLEVGLLVLAFAICVLSRALFLPALILPLFSLLKNVPNPFPFPMLSVATDALSGLFGGLAFFFLDPIEKTSLILAPGETPLLLLRSSAALRDFPPSLRSIVAACWGARFRDGVLLVAEAENVFDLWY